MPSVARSGRFLVALLAVISAGCATTGTPTPQPFPGARKAPTSAPDGATAGQPGAPNTPAASASAPAAPDELRRDKPDASASAPSEFEELRRDRPYDGRALAEFALGFRGVPYRLGGDDPGGFDCSGLVQYVFAQYGISIPRVVEQQFEVGSKIKPKNLRPGDLIFFDTNHDRRTHALSERSESKGPASHVAIALGGDSFVHAPNSSGVVRVETLASSYWGSRYVGARRIRIED